MKYSLPGAIQGHLLGHPEHNGDDHGRDRVRGQLPAHVQAGPLRSRRQHSAQRLPLHHAYSAHEPYGKYTCTHCAHGKYTCTNSAHGKYTCTHGAHGKNTCTHSAH